MTWSAALSDAALRMTRTAAGRRAVQLALLVGGLLAVGLLWGERAHAESGVGALPGGRAVQVDSGVHGAGPAEERLHRAAEERLHRAAGDRTFRAADGVGERVGEGPARTRLKVPTAPSSPRLAAPPQPPAWWPHLDLPRHPLPAPDASDPQPDTTTVPAADAAAHGGGPPPTTASPAGPDTPAHPLRRADHRTSHVIHTSDTSRLSHSSRPRRPSHPSHPEEPPTPTGPAPAEHPSGGQPDGESGNRFVREGGSSRHGDARALTVSLQAPLGLVPGVVARTDATGASDAHRDISLFPA